jgi:1-pyrroline-5-carboxylate dehydrogenase
MSAGAMIAGNTVVFKPSHDTPWTGLLLFEVFRDAGVPDGVFNFLNGPGSVVGKEFTNNPDVDGLIFTGSKEVGMSIYHQFSKEYPKPCITEMGGKNPAIVTAKADLEDAAEGVMRAAFGLGGQKCSACSRVYVFREVEKPFLDLLVQKTEAIKVGDPTQRDVFLGPIINEAAYRNFQDYAKKARKDGMILTGGNVITDGEYQYGFYVEPTVVTELPKDHEFFYEELFVPLLVVAAVDSLEEAIQLSNRAEYGLTAGIFSKDKNEVDTFFDNIDTGVTYANRRSGATTGAWPGVNPFCGWKGSGSSGKGCCGPYYVQQFMREQSRTVMGDL